MPNDLIARLLSQRDLNQDQLRRLLSLFAEEAPASEIKIDQDASDDERSYTIPEFCRVERISQTTYYKLRKLKLAPREMNLPVDGLRLARISATARREWQERMATLSAEKNARLEHQRRAAVAQAAGRLGGQPLHRRKITKRLIK